MNANAISSSGGRALAVVSSLAVLLALGACGKQGEERTVGQQVDSAVAKTEQAAKDMTKDAKSVAQDAKVAAKETAAAVAEKLDDASITASVSASLAKDPELSAIKIDVDTKDGVVNLYGPAPTMSARERATVIAKGVKGVNAVNNQLTIKAG
ncbi:MAG TPA: BON domain-containing protein [Burkholderiaceae bacterium]|nr:BON domain-containing protein [Burkholderiaceae bacterium]